MRDRKKGRYRFLHGTYRCRAVSSGREKNPPFTGIRQSLAETFISFAVGLCVADITDEARKGASLLEQMAGDAADFVRLSMKQVAVQLIRGNKRGSVQEHFRICVSASRRRRRSLYIQNDDAVNISVCKSRRKIRFIRRSRKIRVNEIDIVCRKCFAIWWMMVIQKVRFPVCRRQLQC